MTHIHFINTLLPDRTFRHLFEDHHVKSSAAQTFFCLIARGLAECAEVKVTVHSVLPINPTEQRKGLWSFASLVENGIRFKHIPAVNLPILNNLFTLFYVFTHVLFHRFDSNERNIVLVDYLRFTVNLAVRLACLAKRQPMIAVVTDLPEEDARKQDVRTKLRNMVISGLSFDFYVCLTAELNNRVNQGGKPYLVMEGLADNSIAGLPNLQKDKYPERTLVYAGALYTEYGLEDLVEGFGMVPDTNLRLWFYGVGPFASELTACERADPRISYKGVVPRDKLIPVLLRATLLVNPRPSHGVYTRFSFPSKNMEYMSTGTPLMTCRLPGIPPDHAPFVYFIEDESAIGIAESLSQVLDKSDDELHAFGERCREYTLREKNNLVQAKRILDLISK